MSATAAKLIVTPAGTLPQSVAVVSAQIMPDPGAPAASAPPAPPGELIEALRSVNVVAHFTHFTVSHAHLGLYVFFTIVFFGAMYFVMPRITAREWPFPWLISVHFWLVSLGIAVYFISLTIGGWLQGEAMLDAARPFMDSVAVTLPYLKGRSVGGAMMVPALPQGRAPATWWPMRWPQRREQICW